MVKQALTVMLLCLSVPTFAQVYNAAKDIIDAYDRGVAQRMRQQLFELEKRRAKQELAIEQERLRQMQLRNDSLRHQNQVRQRELDAASQKAQAQTTATTELNNALRAISARYSDFAAYSERMSRLVDYLPPFRLEKMPLDAYLEALYLIAKHSSFGPSLGPVDSSLLAVAAPPEPKPQPTAAVPPVPVRAAAAQGTTDVRVRDARMTFIDCGAVADAIKRINAFARPDRTSARIALTCGEKIALLSDAPKTGPSGEQYHQVRTSNGSIVFVSALFVP